MSSEFEFTNLEEFKNKLNLVCEEYTDTAEKHLKKCGNKLKKMAQENSPSDGIEHTSKKGKKIKPLNKSWKGKITGIKTNEIQYELKSTARHYHLVERGHVQKTPSGRVTGFTQGKHFFEKTVQEFNNSGEIEKELNKFMDDIKKKIGG